MRDITDFSARDSKQFNESVALYEKALGDTDRNLLNFREARRFSDEIPVHFGRKTRNSRHFLDEDRIASHKMNTKTNAIQEFVKEHQTALNETLRFGATKEDLENEVKGDFGREVLEVLQKHNITGKAIWEALDVLKDLIGDSPDIDAALGEWVSKTVEDEEVNEDESIDENKDNFPTNLEEMTKTLRKKIAERRITKRVNLNEMMFLRSWGLLLEGGKGEYHFVDENGKIGDKNSKSLYEFKSFEKEIKDKNSILYKVISFAKKHDRGVRIQHGKTDNVYEINPNTLEKTPVNE